MRIEIVGLLLKICKSQINLIKYFELIEIEESKNDGLSDYMLSTKYSLLEGILSIETGVIHNQRHYGCNVSRSFLAHGDAPNNLWFAAEKQNDSGNIENSDLKDMSTLICKLFPSLGSNTININSNYFSNFSKILYSQHSNPNRTDILILAEILFCCANKGTEVVSNIKDIENEGLILEIRFKNIELIHRRQIIRYHQRSNGKKKRLLKYDRHLIDSLIFLLANRESNHSDINNLVTIKAYISMYLELTGDIRELYKRIDELCKLQDECLQNDHFFTNEIIPLLREKSVIEKFFFKYKPEDSPPAIIMPYFNSDMNEFERGTDSFSNCVENALYNFLNILLLNSEENECRFTNCIKRNQDNSSAIICEIFSGELKSKPSRIDFELLHRNIEALENGKILNMKIGVNEKSGFSEIYKLYPFDHVFYCKGKEKNKNLNEIDTGIINFLNVIEHLTGLRGELTRGIKKVLEDLDWEIPSDFDWRKIEKCLLEAFYKISGDFKDSLNVTISRPEYKSIGNKFDIYGKITVERSFKNSVIKSTKFDISNFPNHSEFIFKEIQFSKGLDWSRIISKRETLRNTIMNNRNSLYIMAFNSLFPEYLTSDIELIEKLLENSLINIFYIGNLDSSAVFKNHHELIYKEFGKSSENCKHLIKSIYINYFKSVPLNEREVFDVYSSFLKKYFDDFSFSLFENEYNWKSSVNLMALEFQSMGFLGISEEEIRKIKIDKRSEDGNIQVEMSSKYLIALLDSLRVKSVLLNFDFSTVEYLNYIFEEYSSLVKNKDIKYFVDIEYWFPCFYRITHVYINHKYLSRSFSKQVFLKAFKNAGSGDIKSTMLCFTLCILPKISKDEWKLIRDYIKDNIPESNDLQIDLDGNLIFEDKQLYSAYNRHKNSRDFNTLLFSKLKNIFIGN